tara:strand:+ start:1082 stop:4309 length:3228 start_codon:yes stop_codon:yes gene_type:complete
MKEQLLLEGAVAGHMNHIYDNGEMTFGELKQLLQAVADGKVRGTEKTDGQNIFLSFNVRTQKAKAIRNKGNIKAGGLDTQGLDEFFSDHPAQALRFSFVDALQAFEDAIKQVDKDTQEKIFGRNNEVYFNTEVMNPGTPGLEEDDPRGKGTTNVIPYDKKTLLIHRVGHGAFDEKTGQRLEQDITQNFDILEQAIAGMSTEDPAIFSVETNQIRRLSPMKDKDVLKKTVSELDNLLRDQSLSDDATINDYVISQVKPEIDALGLTEDRNEMILKRVMNLPGKPNLRQITAGLPVEIKDDVSKFVKEFKYTSYTTYMQNLLHNFSVEAVNGLESAFISDNEKQIKFLQDEIKNTVKRIQDSSNERAKEELARQMEKLKSAEGINTPSEGFVFSWNGVTYKLTGNFAPANQILGMERFQRFGPIEPKEEEEQPSQASEEPLTIALFPGSFKPPHKGHILAAEALAEDADVIYIFVSAPQLSGRALKSGSAISAEQAIQCWNAMIDKSPIKNKARIMVGPAGVASPMMTAINFIQHSPSPDNLYAAPMNATVILGVGAKASDADRYGGKILQKSKEKRPDLNVVTKAVGPFEHSVEYLDLLEKHPSISKILNKGQGRLSPDELSEEERLEGKVADKQLYHASDMRDFIDLATEDPIGLEFLKDFVPHPEDVLAIMGILGLNPADQKDDESDQVSEPEIDQLSEIIFEETTKVLEGFKAQRAPKAKSSSGKFQRKMKKRLSKAHRFYLDQGRKDLTKHGGAFRNNRPKNISNAFLAEEDIEEISVSGNVAGFATTLKQTNDNPNPKRKDIKMKQEKRLRLKVKEGLKSFFKKKAEEHSNAVAQILEEHELRIHLRNLIFEEIINEAEDPTTDIHDNTGINTLKDLLKNTNVLSTLREVYKTLTTSEEQRKSFRAHVILWVQGTLAPVKLNDTDALPDDEAASISEQQDDVGVDILGVNDEDKDKFINALDGSEKESKTKKKPEEKELETISGEDTTGRNKAERIYPNIEKSIIDYYAELDNPEDQEMFYDYLIANLKLYFDKWDGEMSKSVSEPTNSEYEGATAEDSEGDVEQEEDIAL